MACGVQAAAKKLGAKVNIVGGDTWGADVQTPVVNSVTAQHPDAVIVAPNDSKAMYAPLHALAGAGIKLVNDLDLLVTNLDSGQVFAGNNIASGFDFNQAREGNDTNTSPAFANEVIDSAR